MFKSIMTSFCICLQGTVFERRAKKAHMKDRDETWYYSMEGPEEPPYILVAEEFKIRNDLLTKMHTRDGHLSTSRDASKKGRAKWCPDFYEQVYYGPAIEASTGDPAVEVYYRALGLANTREPHAI